MTATKPAVLVALSLVLASLAFPVAADAPGAMAGMPIATIALPEAPPEVASGRVERAAVHARHFAAIAAHPLAAEAGYAVLAKGGSAVDAILAMQWVLGLVEPQSSGLGGGAFLLVHDGRRNRLRAYDGRETAPRAARPDRFLDAKGKPLAFHAAVVGGRSVGVPGVVRMLEIAHRDFGRRSWKASFDPAIALAESGFAVSPRLATLIASERHFVQGRARAYFLDAEGKPWAAGHLLRNPAYARTLRTLASGGADAFYRGALAQDIVATANGFAANPGDLAPDDLAAYRALRREPVCGGYRAYRVCSAPPPSSGGIALLQTLAMLERFDLAATGPASFWSVHLASFAERLAYADRNAFVADPAFVDVPRGLLDPDYLAARGAAIRSDVVPGVVEPGTPPARGAFATAGRDAGAPEFPSTTQLIAVDAQGNAATMTSTIEDQFGSRLMTEGGFLLNNQLTDFSFLPRDAQGHDVANRVEAGKRPRSTMAPTVVYDRQGRVFMLTGSPGGSMIANYVAKAVIGVIDWRLDPQAAVSLGNFGSRNGPVELEQDSDVAPLAPKLRAMGYAVRVGPQTSGLAALVRTPDGWVGGADPRREGAVRGR